MNTLDSGVSEAANPAAPSIWRQIVAFLRRLLLLRDSRQPIDLALEILPEIDVEALMADLRIRDRAIDNGRHEIPGTQDVQPDGPHGLITQAIERQIRAGMTQLEIHLSNLTRRIHGNDVTQDANAVKALPKSLSYNLDQLIERHMERMGPARQRYRSLKRQLEEFRGRHGIRYDPHYPETHLIHWGVLLVILVGEAVLNGRYLARADELGLLGGVTNALVIALVNVSMSWALGRAAHWSVGYRRGFQIMGVLSAGLFLLWASGYNILIAHVRDAMGDTVDYSSARSAWMAMTTTPFTFQDLNSYLLLCLGTGFSLISFADGIRWDDSTFGFSKLDRRVLEARLQYLRAREGVDEKGREKFATAMVELEKLMERIRYRVDSLRNDVEQKRLLEKRAENFFRFAVESCNTMLRVYRDLNRQNRKTQPPAYFQEAWSHSEPALFKVDVARDVAHLDTQESLRREVGRRGEAIKREVEEAYGEFVARAQALREEEERSLGSEPVKRVLE